MKKLSYIKIVIFFMLLLCGCCALANSLLHIDYIVADKQHTQVILRFSDLVAEPKFFTTPKPSRLILDFLKVDSNTLNNEQAVHQGFIDSVLAQSADGQTRIVFNLTQIIQTQVSVQANQVLITLTTPLAQNPLDKNMMNLNFDNLPLKSALKIIAQFAHINIVANDNIQGNISLHLQHVPWQTALQMILKAGNLGQKQTGDIIIVAPLADLALDKKAQLSAEQEAEALAPLNIVYTHLSYANANDIANLLKGQNNSLLSSRGSVSTDPRTNTVIVQDIASNLPQIKQLIKQLDVAVQQVLIEARIVDVDTNFEEDLGVRWSMLDIHTMGDTLPNLAKNANNPALSQHLHIDIGTSDSVMPSNLGIAFANLGTGYMLDMELSAIETEGGAKLISSPRLVTANQHTASIEAGQEIPYQQNTLSGATAVEFEKAVLSLKVTPQITPAGKIMMAIKVTQNKVDPALQVDGVPAIDTREVETNVLVNNGETLVLGGIYEEDHSKTVTRVPFLGSIPGIGFFFRDTHKQNQRAELLIFITPKIVEEK